jgi:hypothetical protein
MRKHFELGTYHPFITHLTIAAGRCLGGGVIEYFGGARATDYKHATYIGLIIIELVKAQCTTSVISIIF